MNTLTLAHKFLQEHVKPGSFCIDATAGRGRDTLFLCNLIGKQGSMLAFDIQKPALESTENLLREQGVLDRVKLIWDSHSNMEKYAEKETVDCIVFNLGWLPGGDHTIFTKAETSIPAITQGLSLLKPGGIMSVCIYYGGMSGYQEKEELLRFFHSIDSKNYTVLVSEFYNRDGDPPIPVFIWKEG